MATRGVRERFLRRLYELSDGSVRRPVPTDHAAQGSGLDERGLDDVTSQLEDSGFIEFYREGGELYPTSVTLTASGVEEAEFLLEQSGETAVEIASDADVAVAEKLAGLLTELLDGGSLDAGEHERALRAELSTLEAQIGSPLPNLGVLRAAVAGLRSIASRCTEPILGVAAWEAARQLGA